MAGLQKGGKSYLALFDILESSDTFDAGLKKKLKQSFPGSSIEPARKHLYHVITKSLRQYNNDQDIESQLESWLQDSRILYNKGLYTLAVDRLMKVKKEALSHEKFMHYILAARQELQYLVRSQFAGISEDDLIKKHEELKRFLEHKSSSIRHAVLYETLLFRYWKNGIVRSKEDITHLDDLLLEELQVLNTQRIRSFESQQLHLHFQSTYFTMIGDPESSLDVFRDLDALFHRYPDLWKDAPLYYVHLLSGILRELRFMERYDEMPYYLDRLKTIPGTTTTLSTMIKYLCFEYELQSLIDRKDIQPVMKLIKAVAPEFERETAQLNLQTRLQLQFVTTRAWFMAGDYSSALKKINAILNQPSGSVYQPLDALCRLMNLQINAMLENTEYLVHAIRSVERKLTSERKLFGVEKLILSILKRWLKLKTIKDLQTQLIELSRNPYEQRLIKELCLLEWLDRMKLQRRR